MSLTLWFMKDSCFLVRHIRPIINGIISPCVANGTTIKESETGHSVYKDTTLCCSILGVSQLHK